MTNVGLNLLLQSVVLTVAATRIAGSIVPVRVLTAVVVGAAAAGLGVEAVGQGALAFAASALAFLAVWVAASRWLDPVAFAGLRALLWGRDPARIPRSASGIAPLSVTSERSTRCPARART